MSPMREIHDKIQQIDAVEDQETLKSSIKDLHDFKAPIADLMSNFNKRLADLNRSLTAAAKMVKANPPREVAAVGAAAAATTSPTTGHSGRPPLTFPEFAEMVARSQTIQAVEAKDLPSLDLAEHDFTKQPMLITGLNAVESVIKVG